MADTDVTLFYNTYRLDALKCILEEQGLDLEQALVPTLDDLYERLVPADQRERIESRITEEAAQEEMEREAAKRFAVIHFHDAEDDYFFTFELRNSFYSIANLYCLDLRDEVGKYTLDSMASCNFSGKEPISDVMFSVLCNAMPNDDRITALVEFDFENGNISVKERGDNHWRVYHLKDVSTAMWKAERQYGLTLAARYKIFDTALEGKEIIFDSESEAPDEESDAPTIQM